MPTSSFPSPKTYQLIDAQIKNCVAITQQCKRIQTEEERDGAVDQPSANDFTNLANSHFSFWFRWGMI